MQHHEPTSKDFSPTAYQLGRMFQRAGREYNPYQPDTPAFTDFNRGRLDEEEEQRLYDELQEFTPHCSSDKQDQLKRDAELRRTQYHMK